MAYDILVKVGADISDFSSKMKESQKAISDFNTKNKEVFSSFKKVGTAVTATGATIAAGLGVAAKQAIDFESSFAGVRKTVDASEAEFAELERGIRDMAKELPASVHEINAVAEAAGQLGIEKENILGFTRTMIDLGESTNMASDVAAESLARFANITQMSQKDFDRLGSSIVELGNNFATTESDITEMAMRLAGAGSQVGMSEADILALATALSSVGIEAEMGGSALSRVMVNMQVATSTGFKKVQEVLKETGKSLRELEMMASHDSEGFGEMAYSLGMTKKELLDLIKAGKDLEGFSEIAGMTSDQFVQAFEKDAIGALGAFIEGLANAEEKGESAINMLQEMGITEIRLRDSLLRAGGASELFADAVEMSTKAWGENSALGKEAGERYKTVASQLGMLKNTVIDAGISIGQALLPAIRLVTSALKGFIEIFNGMGEGVKSFIAISAAIVSALMLIVGPILLLIGFIPQIVTGFGALSTVLSALGGVFAFLTGPIGLIIAAIIAIGAALVIAYQKVEWFRELINGAWAWIQEATMVAFNYIKGVIMSAAAEMSVIIATATAKIKEIWDKHGQSVMTIINTVFGILKDIVKVGMAVIKGVFQAVWPVITGLTKIAWETIKTVVDVGIRLVLGIIDTVMSLLKGDWKGAWETIRETAKEIWAKIEDYFQSIDLVEIGKDIINGLIRGISSMGSAAWEAAKSIASKVKEGFTSFFKIKSPSRVMRDQVGVHIGTGVAAGMKKSTSTVTKSARALAAATNKKFNDAFKSAKYKFDMGQINTAGYVAALKKVRAEYAKTPAHIQKVNLAIKKSNDNALKAEASALKARENLVKKINNTVLSASNSYASKIASVNKKLTDGIKKANDDYKKAFEDRKKQIANQIGLFDKFEAKSVSRTDLIGNLRGQVQAMRDFSGNLAKIGKNAPKAFVDELREMGLDSASEISAIAGMSKKQLNEYVKLWKQKQKAASTEAAKQLEGLKTQTTKKINEMRVAASNELNLLRGQYLQKLRTLAADVKKLGSFRNSGKVLGKNAVAGIINGLGSMNGALSSAAKRIANTITKTVKTTLKIKSPSRVMISLAKFVPLGVARGMDAMIGDVRQASARLTSAMTPEAPAVSMAYTTPDGTYDSLAQAVSGQVDVGNSRDDKVAEAIGRLERKLESLRIEVDKRELGRVVSDTATEQRNQANRGRGHRRI